LLSCYNKKSHTLSKRKTSNHSYIYTFNYDYHHSELCKLESRQIFEKEEKSKLLFSDVKVDPSISSFIKNRVEIISSSESYSELLRYIKELNIQIEGFKVEYLVLNGDIAEKSEKREKLKDIGICIEGEPDFDNPLVIYSIAKYEHIWYFGNLIKQNTDWLKHNNKPCTFSNSICMKIAKTLVSMASKGNKTNHLLDACCGVGTVMLEGCFSGFDIEGCDINLKTSKHAMKNLEYYNYTAKVLHSDVKDLDKKYDAAIIDLPYNLYSYSNDAITLNIIESTAKLTTRLVVVSISNIEDIIKKSGYNIIDFCTVEKRGKSKFTRKIWVCEKENNTMV
jgi:tRNA (guanine10-N2)-dimethyltransferase